FHWFGVIAANLFGRIDEFTLRFPSALFGMFGVLLTYFTGVRLWSERAGFIAAVVLLANVQWWIGATNVQVDMTLAFFLSASCIAFFFLYRDPAPSPWKAAGLAVLLACATLAKGPLGIVVPGLGFLVFLGLRHDFAFIKQLYPWRSGLFFLLLAGSWYLLALWQGGEAFFIRQVIDENLRTATGEMGKPQPLYYFVPVFFANLSPWSLFALPLALFWRRDRDRARLEVVYLLVWLLTSFAVFSLSSGKRAIYILSLYPAAALLWGAWWSEVEKNSLQADRLTLAIAYAVATVYLLAVGGYFAWWWGWDVLRFFHMRQNLSSLARIIFQPTTVLRIGFLISGVAVLVLFGALWRRRLEYVFTAFAALAIFSVVIVKSAFYPVVARELTLKPFIERVSQIVEPSAPLYFYHAFDPGAILYSHRHVRSYEDFSASTRAPFYLLMWEEEWARLNGSNGLTALAMSEGTGPARRHRMVLVRALEKIAL
ncbi:MAG TPA: glycosyltransferase family 39 protein, partial [Candidatus Limnocylindrales bacterium]|nr:glycosyltransferase family 39 protein [Candidatus Limnocylindrales bacterium]